MLHGHFKKLADKFFFKVVGPLHILVAHNQKLAVEGLQIFHLGNGYKHVPPMVANLVLHVSFFVTAADIAKNSREAAVVHETQEIFSKLTFTIFQDLLNYSG